MTARILDRGYRRYSGDRRGARGAIRTLVLHSVQRALGLRRSAWTKLLPFGIVALAYVPAIVFVGVVSLVPDSDLTDFALPSYSSYFSYMLLLVVLFVAFVAPEILCTDRRTGMLGVYLASPLTRDTYLVAKALATAAVLALVTIGPPLVMLVAFIIQGEGPDGPAEVASTLARIAGAGLAISVLYTAFSMGISSLTDRKAFATAGLILFFLMSNVVTGVLVGVLEVGDDAVALNIFVLPFALVEKIHAESTDFSTVTTTACVLGTLAWTAVWATVCRVRYAHLQVTR